jgi:hypothetical protein
MIADLWIGRHSGFGRLVGHSAQVVATRQAGRRHCSPVELRMFTDCSWASLRLCDLCVRFLLQPPDDTGNGVFAERCIEADLQAKSLVGQPQTCETLLFVNPREGLDRLDLEDPRSATIKLSRNRMSLRIVP